MAKRNQVTADLRISANAQLKNSQSFIKELEKITKLTNEIIKLEFYVNNLQSKENVISKIVEEELLFKNKR